MRAVVQDEIPVLHQFLAFQQFEPFGVEANLQPIIAASVAVE